MAPLRQAHKNSEVVSVLKRRNSIATKPTCDICQKQFTLPNSLCVHKISVHEVGYPSKLCCKHCGYATHRGFALKRHIENKHKDKQL